MNKNLKEFDPYAPENMGKGEKIDAIAIYKGDESVSDKAIRYVGGDDPRKMLVAGNGYKATIQMYGSYSVVIIDKECYNSVFFTFLSSSKKAPL